MKYPLDYTEKGFTGEDLHIEGIFRNSNQELVVRMADDKGEIKVIYQCQPQKTSYYPAVDVGYGIKEEKIFVRNGKRNETQKV